MRIRIRFVLLDPDTFVFRIRIQVQVLKICLWFGKNTRKTSPKLIYFHVFEFFLVLVPTPNPATVPAPVPIPAPVPVPVQVADPDNVYHSLQQQQKLYKILPFHSQKQYYFPECLPLLLDFLTLSMKRLERSEIVWRHIAKKLYWISFNLPLIFWF